MTNALIKTMKDKLGDSVTKEIIYQGVYGNGFYLTITNEDDVYFKGFDLRYDRTFKKAEKKKWIEEFAKNYWNGKNGAWGIKSLEIKEMK